MFLSKPASCGWLANNERISGAVAMDARSIWFFAGDGTLTYRWLHIGGPAVVLGRFVIEDQDRKIAQERTAILEMIRCEEAAGIQMRLVQKEMALSMVALVEPRSLD